mmetsp:Transcript_30138/g.63019  ORF Transcript_30138/g.63019 Transcript_30138/m.63019 type:complete len:209 (+) Transcript_30138:108-734(+)
MSKQELQQRACKASGVTFEESLKATQLVPSLYERLGRESGTEELSRLFYERVFDDSENVWFLSIFASSTKAEAIDNQYRFFVQTFGGPELYRQKGKGRYTRLSGRHANYPIGHRAADRWIQHMDDAMDEHPKLKEQSSLCSENGNRSDGDGDRNNDKSTDGVHTMITETKQALRSYFRYTAHYIVVASEYMRDDQLSGGTQIDEGRVW